MEMYGWTGWKHIPEALEQALAVHLPRNKCHDEEESLQNPETRRQRTIENIDTYIAIALSELTLN